MSETPQERRERWIRALSRLEPPLSPRLFVRAEKLEALRAKREVLSEMWNRLRHTAEDSLSRDLPTHNDPAIALSSGLARARTMAFVGWVDDRTDLKRGVWRYVEPALGSEPLSVGWVMSAHVPLKVDLGYSSIASSLGRILDWAGDALSDAQRRRLQEELVERVRLYWEIGSTETERWAKATHNWRSVICGEMGVAAMSVAEKLPHLADVLALSVTGVDVVLNAEGTDGSHSEGVGYWGYGIGQAAWFAKCLKEFSEGTVDLFEHPYLKVTGDYALHISTPDGTCFGYEDCAPQSPNPWLCALLASEYRQPAYQWLARRVSPSVEAFLFTDPTIPAEPPAHTPQAKYFPAIETATSRSGWEENATFFGIHAGKTTVNHAHLDIGTFWLVGQGSRLVGDGGIWPYDHSEFFFNSRGPRWDYEANATLGHNTLLVNGKGQTYAVGCEGKIVEHRFGETFDLFRVDAGAAYGDSLKRFERLAVLLKPDVLLLMDEVEAKEPSQFAWLVHPEGSLNVDDTRWIALNGNARLTIDILGHETLGRGDGYRVGVAERTTFYHDRVDTPVRRVNRVVSFETLHPRTQWNVVAVFQINNANLPIPLRPSLRREGETWQIEGVGWRIYQDTLGTITAERNG